MSIFDWLPQDPWVGPPLPRFLAITWPWANTGLAPASLPTLPTVSGGRSSKTTATYDNTETVEFPEGFDPDTFMPRKIVIHRNARVSQ